MESRFVTSYRTQLSRRFPMKKLIREMPYLERLGVDILCTSPYMQVVKGSNNPYEISDPNALESSVTSQSVLERFFEKLAKHGLAHVYDLVPNHMAAHVENLWFYDVLQCGQESQYASYFDIDWDASGSEGKVVLPYLPYSLEESIRKNLLKINAVGEAFCLDVSMNRLPLSLESQRYLSKKTLKALNLDDASLIELIGLQHYRLVPWMEGHRRVNYRRFFDIQGLIGLSMEKREVVEEHHRWLFEHLERGLIQGVRVDHPDGLGDLSYLETLKEHAPYVVVEKILQPDEALRSNWACDGSVGYDYLNNLSNLYIDSSHEEKCQKLYETCTQRRRPIKEVLHGAKVDYMKRYLASDLNILTERLFHLQAVRSQKRVLSQSEIHLGLIELLARMPIYRTYLRHHSELESDDCWAIRLATSAMECEVDIVSYFKDLFLSPKDETTLAILKRIQQLMPAVFAKGFEDTALYRNFTLTSRNEVGGSLEQFGISIDDFHRKNTSRLELWPRTMNPMSTHDTKRSEDTRLRISVLSEIPTTYEHFVKKWMGLHRPYKKKCKGALLPDRNIEYLFYQTVIGTLPFELPVKRAKKVYIKRIKEYMLKAAREAKEHTDWVFEDTKYEKQLLHFIDKVLKQSYRSAFWRSLIPLQKKIAGYGVLNSLSAIALRAGSPGIMDLYQGTEVFSLCLVDPDNRREVDYAYLKKELARVRQADRSKHLMTSIEHWVQEEKFDTLKMLMTWKALQMRKEFAQLLMRGEYRPLMAEGPMANHIIAYMRKEADCYIIVVATRFHSKIEKEGLEGTFIAIDQAFRANFCRELFTGREWVLHEKILVDHLLQKLPAAILIHKPVHHYKAP